MVLDEFWQNNSMSVLMFGVIAYIYRERMRDKHVKFL